MENNFEFCSNFDCDYNKYYSIQAGGNLDLKEISYYTGKPYQRGYNSFTKFARNYGIPILNYLKNKTLSFGKNFLHEILSGEDPKQSIKNNLKRTLNESLDDIKTKISQTGKKRKFFRSNKKIIQRKRKTRSRKRNNKKRLNRKSPHFQSKPRKRKKKKSKNIFD